MKVSRFRDRDKTVIGSVIHLHDKSGDLRVSVAYSVQSNGAVSYGTTIVSDVDIANHIENIQTIEEGYYEDPIVTKRIGYQIAVNRCLAAIKDPQQDIHWDKYKDIVFRGIVESCECIVLRKIGTIGTLSLFKAKLGALCVSLGTHQPSFKNVTAVH